MSINLAGPAYRVTVPACVLVATLRKKLKAKQAKQEANKTNKTWFWLLFFCILIGLAVLAVFYMKGKHQSSNNPSNNPKSGVEKLKNPSHKN